MIIYFAGEGHGQALVDCGVKHKLVSAYTLNYSKPLAELKSKFPDLLMDSGGFTARIRGIKVSARQYADYINQEKLDLAFELDTSDPKETEANRLYLKAKTDAYIIPVYHYSDFIDPDYRSLIDDFVAEYNFISIGGVAGVGLGNEAEALYRYVFYRTRDRIKVHGLGITDTRVLKTYPFYSVDSTSWLGAARYGPDNYIRPVDFGYKRGKSVKHQSTSRKSLAGSNAYERIIPDIKMVLKHQEQITNLWEKRGVAW